MKLSDGSWLRFSDYEIRDGYIRPTAKAMAKRYLLASNEDEEIPAYVSLTRMASDAVTSGKTEVEKAILGWCRRYGLLGILLQRAESVTFPVFRDSNDEHGESQTSFVRVADGWKEQNTCHLMEPLPDPRPVGVVLHGLGSSEGNLEPLAPHWIKFFPSIPASEAETFSYPHPYDEGFWKLYAEPVAEFLEAATFISDALNTIATARTTRGEQLDGVSDHALAIGNLNGCTSSIRLLAQPGRDGSVALRWRASTLLASLALTALQDLSANTEPRRCLAHGCGLIFMSSAWQGRYCSERCRWRAVKKKSRAKRSKPAPRKRSR